MGHVGDLHILGSPWACFIWEGWDLLKIFSHFSDHGGGLGATTYQYHAISFSTDPKYCPIFQLFSMIHPWYPMIRVAFRAQMNGKWALSQVKTLQKRLISKTEEAVEKELPRSCRFVVFWDFRWGLMRTIMVSCVNLITTSLRPNPGIMANKGKHPQMAQLFRLVKYYNLPRWYHGLWNMMVN